MKDIKKILLLLLPPAVEAALAEQLAPLPGYALLAQKRKGEETAADLVVTGQGKNAPSFPGRPVLSLPPGKPFRLGAVLRRMEQMLAQPAFYLDDIAIGPCVFSPQEKLLTRAQNQDIPLTDREVDILAYLAKRHGTPVSRDDLLKNVWQYQEGVDTHTLETHIYRLRQKLEISAEDPQFLVTAESGYCLQLQGKETT